MALHWLNGYHINVSFRSNLTEVPVWLRQHFSVEITQADDNRTQLHAVWPTFSKPSLQSSLPHSYTIFWCQRKGLTRKECKVISNS